MSMTLESRPDSPSVKRQRPGAVSESGILPLENGDHLTRKEFDRRWDAMPWLKKAELIDGVVYLQAAVRHSFHGRPHALIVNLISTYFALTPGVDGGDNASALIDDKNEPQPDAYLMLESDRGGQVIIDEDGYLNGTPELIVEVASSSASYDLFKKSDLYLRSGVKEYVIWKALESAFVFRRSQDGVFKEVIPGDDGIFHSETFPGLWLDTHCLIQGDLAGTMKTLQSGLASAEHQSFLKDLETSLTDSSRDETGDSGSTITE
jgi:Uma2 family endonuclease